MPTTDPLGRLLHDLRELHLRDRLVDLGEPPVLDPIEQAEYETLAATWDRLAHDAFTTRRN